MTFEQWRGLPITNTFGGKPLIDFDGVPMFAELAIMKLFETSGWHARWIETYGAKVSAPFHFSNWIDGKLNEQPIDLIRDVNVLKILDELSVLNGNSYSGCWDVVGWNNNRIIFAEAKRTQKDKIRDTQSKWLRKGLQHGLSVDDFLVVQWDYI